MIVPEMVQVRCFFLFTRFYWGLPLLLGVNPSKIETSCKYCVKPASFAFAGRSDSPMSEKNNPKSLQSWLIGLCVTVLGLLVSALLAHQQAQSMEQVQSARFAQATSSVTELFLGRIDAYTEIALGLRSLFVVNPELSRRAFVDAVQLLDVNTRYPGVKNIAFTRYVANRDKQRFEEQVRADRSLDALGYPGFAIVPPGERDEYYVADYLWPLAGNEGIHGLDIGNQPANLASMKHSRRSGEPVASAPFDLVQEKAERTGFVIRVPVFRIPSAVAPDMQADSNFLGSVALTVRVADLIGQMQRQGRLQGLRLMLSDVGSSIAGAPQGPLVPMFVSASAEHSEISQRREISVYGRRWMLEFHALAPLLSDSERRAPLLIGFCGAVVSLLLGGLVTLLARERMHALQLAALSRAALTDSESRWKFAIEGSGDGLWDWNVADNTVFFSARWKQMLGYRDEEIGNDFSHWRQRVHPDDLQQALLGVSAHLEGTTPVYVNEHRLQCKDGSWKWILSRGMVIQRDTNGKPRRAIGTHTDITERKLAQQALQDSLQDKDALLKEVHHRVKNNLQVIASLLRLEGRRATHHASKAVLEDMQGRIRTMALLHESLYRSGTFASVDLGDYLGKLARQSLQIDSGDAARIQLDLHLASLQVGMDQAMTCGLLLNELLSNCLKHAFPGQRRGNIRIDLRSAHGAQHWCLLVGDDGVGPAPDWSQRRQSSLGLQLAHDLATQLGGTLEMGGQDNGQGMLCKVCFEALEPAALVLPV